MKYDRPVWQIMHACADDLPDVFRLTEVRAWFAEHYPEVGDATIRAHLVGLTEGGEKHPQFQRRSPVFRRVARGEYTPIPFDDRGELPEDSAEDPLPHAAADDDRGRPERDTSDKAERKRRKAAKREAKRLAQVEAERQQRALEIERDLQEFDEGDPAQPMVETSRADEKLAEDRRAWQRDLEVESGRLLAARDEAERVEEQARRDRVAAHAEIEVARRRLASERAELAQTAAERAEAGRVVQAEIDAERRRLAGDRTRAQSSDHLIDEVRSEAERASAAQRETSRLLAERLEAERAADAERKRTRKLRKAARHDREEADDLQRESVERIARHAAERRARETVEIHLRDLADRRRAEEDDRRRVSLAVREELARIEHEAVDAERERTDRDDRERERAERERAEGERVEREQAERDQREFARAEAERVAFERAESQRRDREQAERRRLAEEEHQLDVTLRPMVDDDAPAPPADPTPSRRRQREPRYDPGFDDPGFDDSRTPTASDASVDPAVGHAGMVIIRAPRPEGEQAPDPTRDWTSTMTPDDVTEPATYDPADLSTGAVADVVIVGSLGERLGVPAPARDAFRDREFQLVRHACESLDQRWFVLSADHGLLHPMEWVSPEERGMADLDAAHHAVWASWVVARLESLVGPLSELHVEVTAPASVGAPVRTALLDAGVVVTAGPTWIGIDDQDDAAPEDAAPEDTAPEDTELDEAEAEEVVPDDIAPEDSQPEPEEPAAQRFAVVGGGEVIPFHSAYSVADHLADEREAVPASAADDLPDLPGLYAWSVDHEGSRLLNRALMLPVRAGVIFVGEVGGGSRFSDSHASLNEHVTRVQLHGRTRASTFRMTLATALSRVLGLRTIEDPRLTQWMLEHLSISVWPSEDVEGLGELSASVVNELHPALNVDRAPAFEYRDRLAQLRRRLA